MLSQGLKKLVLHNLGITPRGDEVELYEFNGIARTRPCVIVITSKNRMILLFPRPGLPQREILDLCSVEVLDKRRNENLGKLKIRYGSKTISVTVRSIDLLIFEKTLTKCLRRPSAFRFGRSQHRPRR